MKYNLLLGPSLQYYYQVEIYKCLHNADKIKHSSKRSDNTEEVRNVKRKVVE